MKQIMLILYKRKPLIVIQDVEDWLPSEVLFWYSENFGYDLKDLTYTMLPRMTLKGLK